MLGGFLMHVFLYMYQSLLLLSSVPALLFKDMFFCWKLARVLKDSAEVEKCYQQVYKNYLFTSRITVINNSEIKFNKLFGMWYFSFDCIVEEKKSTQTCWVAGKNNKQ